MRAQQVRSRGSGLFIQANIRSRYIHHGLCRKCGHILDLHCLVRLQIQGIAGKECV